MKSLSAESVDTYILPNEYLEPGHMKIGVETVGVVMDRFNGDPCL